MKKRIFIFLSKKYIILSVLTIFLGVAVFINWQFANDNQSITVADIFSSKNDSKKTDNATLVSSSNNPEKFFDEARKMKNISKNNNISLLTEVVNSAETSKEQKDAATRKIMDATNLSAIESNIENKITTSCSPKINDCIAYKDNAESGIHLVVSMQKGQTLENNSNLLVKMRDIITSTDKDTKPCDITINEYFQPTELNKTANSNVKN